MIIFGSVVNGMGVAFEEQMGVHGAFGGAQAYPFLLYPDSAEHRIGQIRTAHDLYGIFSSYLPRSTIPFDSRELATLQG
jgi:hypothetical protein